MKSSEKDMAVMLDELGLPAAALRWRSCKIYCVNSKSMVQ